MWLPTIITYKVIQVTKSYRIWGSQVSKKNLWKNHFRIHMLSVAYTIYKTLYSWVSVCVYACVCVCVCVCMCVWFLFCFLLINSILSTEYFHIWKSKSLLIFLFYFADIEINSSLSTFSWTILIHLFFQMICFISHLNILVGIVWEELISSWNYIKTEGRFHLFGYCE